jgi:hypothetical protein
MLSFSSEKSNNSGLSIVICVELTPILVTEADEYMELLNGDEIGGKDGLSEKITLAELFADEDHDPAPKSLSVLEINDI